MDFKNFGRLVAKPGRVGQFNGGVCICLDTASEQVLDRKGGHKSFTCLDINRSRLFHQMLFGDVYLGLEPTDGKFQQLVLAFALDELLLQKVPVRFQDIVLVLPQFLGS